MLKNMLGVWVLRGLSLSTSLYLENGFRYLLWSVKAYEERRLQESMNSWKGAGGLGRLGRHMGLFYGKPSIRI